MFSEIFGGNTTTFINNEVQYFSQMHELKYMCTKKAQAGIFIYENIEEIEYKPNKIKNKIKWWLWQLDLYLNFFDSKFSNQVNKIIKEFDPDIIHCHFGYEALILLDNLENLDKHKIIIHFHGYDATAMLKRSSYVKRLKEMLQKKNVYPIFVSKYLKNHLEQKGIDTSRGTVLYCGIDLSKFIRPNENNNKNDEIVFLQVSSLSEKKGHEYTIQAFALFLNNKKEKKYRLILTGDGDRKTLLEQLVKQLNIQNYVDFVGFISPEKAKILMAKADVFLHHSVTARDGDKEGIPTALMEAMAMELPVISTYHSGIPELIIDGVNGYLVEEKDIDSYVKRMEDVISMGKIKRNRKVIEDGFEMQRHNEILERIYCNTVNTGNK